MILDRAIRDTKSGLKRRFTLRNIFLFAITGVLVATFFDRFPTIIPSIASFINSVLPFELVDNLASGLIIAPVWIGLKEFLESLMFGQ